MPFEVGGYEFEGLHFDSAEIEMRQGVYVVVCVVDGELHCLLDVGTSGQLKERLGGHHDRHSCWKEQSHGEIGFGVLYTGHGSDVDLHNHAPPAVRKSDEEIMKERLMIEDELQWKYDVPCGTNHWKQKEKAIARYNAYEQMFGPRGHGELN